MVELDEKNVKWHRIPLAKDQASLATSELLMSLYVTGIHLYTSWNSVDNLYWA